MKKAIIVRNLLNKVFYCFDSLFRLNNGSLIVLCYHSFSNNGNRYAVKKSVFEQQLSRLKWSADFIGYDEFLSYKKNKNVNKPKALITIDDGFKSVLDILPITKKLGIPVTLFVLAQPQYANRSELKTNEELLSWDEIKYLKKSGWTIGSHGLTHADISKLKPEEAAKEIALSKAIIESKIGSEVTTFAFPKGHYSDSLVNVARNAGYHHIFSVEAGYVDSLVKGNVIPRTIIDSSHGASALPDAYTQSWLKFRQFTNRFKLWERFLA